MPSSDLKNLLSHCNNGELGDVIDRAKRMGELTHILSRALPESERSAIVAANLREDGELVVICASSAWASRLRYESEKLLQTARDAGLAVHSCRVRVSQG